MQLYLVFSGTTDWRDNLFLYLNGGEVTGYTALRSVGGWRGAALGGDLLLFFDHDDAVKVSRFLLEVCGQKSAPILSINATEVPIACA